MPTMRTLLILGSLLALNATAGAETPRALRDYLGPQYESRGTGTPSPEACHRALRWRPIRYATGTGSRSMRAGSTTRRPRRAKTACSASSWGRAGRAVRSAIVHIAMFDAVNAIVGGYQSYAGICAPRLVASIDAAIAQAAHDTLVRVFPSQRKQLRRAAGRKLEQIGGNPRHKARRQERRTTRAAAILAMRKRRRLGAEPRTGIGTATRATRRALAPGSGQPDPDRARRQVGQGTAVRIALGQAISHTAAAAMASEAYTRAFNEAKALGGDGVTTPTDRTEEQTQIGIYWAYDGTPSLCAPPRLYNQIVETISARSNRRHQARAPCTRSSTSRWPTRASRIWESKYFYDFWRPVTGIREADEDTGPTGAGDGNPATYGDLGFMPLAHPRAISAARISRRPSRRTRRAMPDSAVRCSRLAALLRERPRGIYVHLRRIERRDGGQRRATCGRWCPAASIRSARRRRRTARAGSTSAFTGSSTRRKASGRGAALRITCSTMPFSRFRADSKAS